MTEARGVCPECGGPMIPTLSGGMKCARLGSCGRGGLEERRASRRV